MGVVIHYSVPRPPIQHVQREGDEHIVHHISHQVKQRQPAVLTAGRDEGGDGHHSPRERREGARCILEDCQSVHARAGTGQRDEVMMMS